MDPLDDQPHDEVPNQDGSGTTGSNHSDYATLQGRFDPTNLDVLKKYIWPDDSGIRHMPIVAGSSSSKQAENAKSDSGGTYQKKRIFICCDGTWQNAIGTNRPLTNVARFVSSITPRGDDGIVQIVYYASGIGSKPDNTSHMPQSIVERVSDVQALGQRMGDRYNKYVGGGTGSGTLYFN
jgi:hypothetical protein